MATALANGINFLVAAEIECPPRHRKLGEIDTGIPERPPLKLDRNRPHVPRRIHAAVKNHRRAKNQEGKIQAKQI